MGPLRLVVEHGLLGLSGAAAGVDEEDERAHSANQLLGKAHGRGQAERGREVTRQTRCCRSLASAARALSRCYRLEEQG